MGYTLEQLTAAGGKLWEKNGMRRVYFNSLQTRLGLDVTRYGTGNISSASLKGESISNSRARELVFCCENSKIWYDLISNEFHGKIMGCRDYSSDKLFDIFVESIKSDIETPETTNESESTTDTESAPSCNATTKAKKYIRCKKCGQGGHAGSYPFSTCYSSGICDDCF